MRTFVISLERSVDRRAYMQRELARAGIPYAFFDAFDGAADRERIAPFYSPQECARRLGRPLEDGELGCFLSHHTLWQRAAASDEPFLIIEDDVDFAPGAGGLLGLIEETAHAVALVRLAQLRQRRGRTIRELGGGFALVRYSRRLGGTQCYALSPEGARKLLAGAARWVEPVDEYLDRFWVHGLDIIGLVPFIAREREDGEAISEIGIANRRVPLRGLTKARRELVRIGDAARRGAANFRAWSRHYGGVARSRLGARLKRRLSPGQPDRSAS